MLGHIIKKEIVSHVLSLRFTVAFILLLILVFASVYISVNEYDEAVDGYHARLRSDETRIKEISKEKDDSRRYDKLFWWEGRSAAISISPLAWLGQGLQPSYPAAINVKGGQQTRNIRASTMRNPWRGLLRVPDFVYVVNVVLSFLALLFIFDTVCGEKQAGTLRLMLSNAVPRHTVLLGKWIGGFTVLIVPFLLAAVGALLYARSAGALRPENVGAVAMVVVLACLYVAVFFNIGLFVSTLTVRANTSLLVCLLIWVLFILVIPNMAPVTAKILEPTPPLESVRAEKKAVDEEIWLKINQIEASGQLSYGRSTQDAVEKLERERTRRKAKWDEYYKDSLARQMDLAETFGRLSPSACWTYAALAMTGTGPAAYEAISVARNSLASEFDAFRQRMRKKREEMGREPGWSAFLPEEVPSLNVVWPTLNRAVNVALNDVLILAILNVVFFMLGFMKFLRYDVR